MRKVSWLALLLTVWLPGAATAQAPGELSGPLGEVVREAREQGLPADVLERKIREGQLKRVSEERLMEAVTGLRGDLLRARESLVAWYGAEASRDAIIAGAQALRSGVELESLSGAITASTLSPEVVIRFATDLRLRGVPADLALGLTRSVAAGAPGDVARVLGALDRLGSSHGGDMAAAARELAGAAARNDARRGFGPWLDSLGGPPGSAAMPGVKGGDPDTGDGKRVPPGLLKKDPAATNPGASGNPGTAGAPGQNKDKPVPPGQAKDKDKDVPPGQAKDKAN